MVFGSDQFEEARKKTYALAWTWFITNWLHVEHRIILQLLAPHVDWLIFFLNSILIYLLLISVRTILSEKYFFFSTASINKLMENSMRMFMYGSFVFVIWNCCWICICTYKKNAEMKNTNLTHFKLKMNRQTNTKKLVTLLDVRIERKRQKNTVVLLYRLIWCVN